MEKKWNLKYRLKYSVAMDRGIELHKINAKYYFDAPVSFSEVVTAIQSLKFDQFNTPCNDYEYNFFPVFEEGKLVFHREKQIVATVHSQEETHTLRVWLTDSKDTYDGMKNGYYGYVEEKWNVNDVELFEPTSEYIHGLEGFGESTRTKKSVERFFLEG